MRKVRFRKKTSQCDVDLRCQRLGKNLLRFTLDAAVNETCLDRIVVVVSCIRLVCVHGSLHCIAVLHFIHNY